MDWPKDKNKPVVLPNLVAMNARITEVESVKLLGYGGELKRKRHPDGLPVWFPKGKPGEYAYALTIRFKK